MKGSETDKASLRKRLLEKRLALGPDDWRERSRGVAQQLAKHPLFLGSAHVALFQSFRNEVDLSSLRELCPDKTFYYPRTDIDQGSMEFLRFEAESDFAPNRWGVLEPQRGDTLGDKPPPLIVVPGLAFDRRGHRLGYGKGFYDRFLSMHPFSSLGVCFSEFLLESLPAETHDRIVNGVVTECAWQDVSARAPW